MLFPQRTWEYIYLIDNKIVIKQARFDHRVGRNVGPTVVVNCDGRRRVRKVVGEQGGEMFGGLPWKFTKNPLYRRGLCLAFLCTNRPL